MGAGVAMHFPPRAPPSLGPIFDPSQVYIREAKTGMQTWQTIQTSVEATGALMRPIIQAKAQRDKNCLRKRMAHQQLWDLVNEGSAGASRTVGETQGQE